MGRAPVHSADDFVDAAIGLYAAGGARAVTMAAVARAVGAPSGSVYHRFADRPALLAAVWLRTVGRFQDSFREVVAGPPSVELAVAAARWTVEWCRQHVGEAIVLHAGVHPLSPDLWAADARRALAGNAGDRDRWLDALAQGIAAETGRREDEVLIALLDLPRAVVGRHLARGEAPPADAVDLAARVAHSILEGSA